MYRYVSFIILTAGCSTMDPLLESPFEQVETDNEAVTDTVTSTVTNTVTVEVPVEDTGELTDTGDAWGPCDIPERRLYDLDGDLYGDPDNYLLVGVCEPWAPNMVNWIDGRDDCDDSNPEVHPDALEVCDWIVDNNCDGVIDPTDYDGDYDANGDGNYSDPGDIDEYNGPDGYTACYPYHTLNDTDGDRYCATGYDANGDGDCLDTEAGDVLYPNNGTCPDEYSDCSVTDPDVYPGNGC